MFLISLAPRTEISLSKVKEINRQITIDKWGRRWENTIFHQYKQFVPALCKNSVRHRSLELKNTTRKGAKLSSKRAKLIKNISFVVRKNCTYMSKFLLYIIFITKDRKSNHV